MRQKCEVGKRVKYIGLLLAVMLIMASSDIYITEVRANSLVASIEVATNEELLSALSGDYDEIVVTKSITVSNGTEESGRMIPLYIPGNVTICGKEDVSLDFRCPVQVNGDNVVIQNIEMLFSSATALGSVAHREIFLAGHSLTLDGVETYLEGSDGALGGLGGTEAELLPTVYAGGFTGTLVGTGASLNVTNATSKTVFEDIYMGHDAGTDAKVPYAGSASLSLCTGVSVRGGIYTEENSSAEIAVSGSGNLSDMFFYGNSATEITATASNLYRAGIYNVGDVRLYDSAYLQLTDGSLHNIDITNASCVDFNSLTNVTISGDFTGGSYNRETDADTRGVLVLNENGSLTVTGQVKGSTWFYTENRNFAGDYADKTYIKASSSERGAEGFLLPESETDYYDFSYENGSWTICSLYEETVYPTVAAIDISEQPISVDVAKIRSTGCLPAPQAPYCKIQWMDEEGNVIDAETVEEMYLYDFGAVIGIKTQYWEDETCMEPMDWGNAVMFVTGQTPGCYYFYANQESKVKSGEYTYLFCDEYYFGDLNTVSDVRVLSTHIKAQMKVCFYDSSKGESAPGESEDNPEDDPGSTPTVSGNDPENPSAGTENPGNTPYSPQAPGVSAGTGQNTNPLEKTIAIKLKKPTIRKVTAKKKSFVVKWKKSNDEISGYQIQYSTSKKFSGKKTKTVTVKGKKKTSKSIKKLKAGKKYYVRIRTYKTVKVNGKTAKIYSAWSKVKRIKTK